MLGLSAAPSNPEYLRYGEWPLGVFLDIHRILVSPGMALFLLSDTPGEPSPDLPAVAQCDIFDRLVPRLALRSPEVDLYEEVGGSRP